MKRIIVFIALIMLASQYSSQAQPESEHHDLALEKQLLALHGLADTFLYFPIAEVRDRANKAFIPMLVDVLKTPGSFYDPLDTLRTKINIVYPPDSSFRIFNWEVRVTDKIIRYYGALQMRDESLRLFPLLDYSAELTDGAEDSVLYDGKWFGGIIYKIHQVQLPDGNTAYMTFSLNRGDEMASRKILDALVFVEGKPDQFGLPFINTPEGVKNRYIIEYNKMANVSLNYNPTQDMIYFDVTKSEVNNDNVKYTRIPVGDYAGFKWNGSSWNFVPQIMNYVEYKEGQAPVAEPVKGEGLFDR